MRSPGGMNISEMDCSGGGEGGQGCVGGCREVVRMFVPMAPASAQLQLACETAVRPSEFSIGQQFAKLFLLLNVDN